MLALSSYNCKSTARIHCLPHQFTAILCCYVIFEIKKSVFQLAAAVFLGLKVRIQSLPIRRICTKCLELCLVSELCTSFDFLRLICLRLLLLLLLGLVNNNNNNNNNNTLFL